MIPGSGGRLTKPPAAASWAAALILAAAWGGVRLVIFQDFVFPLTYVLPLLICVWTRSRPMLWTMAAAFVAMHSVSQFVILPPGALTREAARWTYVATIVNIVVAAAIVEVILALRSRLERAVQVAEENRAQAERYAATVAEQASQLAAQNEELSQQAEELARQSEELSQHAEELNRQSEELAAQNEELQAQSEEIQGLNTELGSREELLQALLEAARTSEGERVVADRLCAAALELVGPPGVVAVLRERDGEHLVVLGSAGIPQASAVAPSEPCARSFAAVVMREGRTASLNDRSLRPDLALLDLAGGRPFQSVLCSPVEMSGQSVGVLEVYARQRHEWTDEQYRLVRWLALQGSQILETLRLQERTRRQAALIDLSPDATIVKTPGGRISFWSQGAEALYGWKREEVLGRSISEVLHTRAAGDARDVDALALAAGGWHGELLHRTRDGRDIVVESRWQVRRDADGAAVEILESNIDVTERKRAIEALHEADRHKNRFLATLSHELRSPLAPIRYALQLLGPGSGEAAGSDGFRPREVIERQLAHLVRLVDDLLDVTRIASNKIRLQKRTVALDAVVRQAIEATSPEIDKAGHRLVVSLPPYPVWLDADPERLAQVLINLLGNAARYTPDGGTITIEAREEGNTAAVSVKDSGIGIAAADLPSLFKMFSQVGDRPTGGGLGIGLALVKGVVELHGGRIEARSEGLGRGSEFLVTLPLAPEPAAETTGLPRPAPAAARRVLVVDDNRDTAEMMKTLLAVDGHDTHAVYDGPSALRAAREIVPDVVLLDIGLPGMDGYEVARNLRIEPSCQRAFLVAVTGWGQEDDRARARQHGFDAHLTKPADPDEVRRLVASVARRVETEGDVAPGRNLAPLR